MVISLMSMTLIWIEVVIKQEKGFPNKVLKRQCHSMFIFNYILYVVISDMLETEELFN